MADDPLWSVMLVTAIDVLAFWPTVRKSWAFPDEEKAQTYALSTAKYALMLVALDSVNVTTVLYPASQVIMSTLFVMMLTWRRKRAALTLG